MNPSPITGLVEQAVEAWHDSGKPLHEWLGWSWDEYVAWAADPSAVPRVPKHYAALPTPTIDRQAIELAIIRAADRWLAAQYGLRPLETDIAHIRALLHPIDDISETGEAG